MCVCNSMHIPSRLVWWVCSRNCENENKQKKNERKWNKINKSKPVPNMINYVCIMWNKNVHRDKTGTKQNAKIHNRSSKWNINDTKMFKKRKEIAARTHISTSKSKNIFFPSIFFRIHRERKTHAACFQSHRVFFGQYFSREAKFSRTPIYSWPLVYTWYAPQPVNYYSSIVFNI